MSHNGDILFIAPDAPWPLDSGVHQRQFHILAALSQAAPLDMLVLPRSPGPIPDQVASLCRKVRVQPQPARTGAGRPHGPVRRLFRQMLGWPIDQDPLSRSLTGKLNNGHDYGLIWIERLPTALVLRHPGGANVALDLDDVEHRKLLESRASRRLSAARYLRVTIEGLSWRSAERAALRRFGRVLVCNEDDRQYLSADNVAVVANGVAVPNAPFTAGVPGRMLFVGMMSYTPNDDAMQYFVTDILPRVRSASPDAHVHIVGGGVRENLKAMDDGRSVRVLGFVDDLARQYAEAAITVVPLRIAGGTTIKILESLAARTPVVASPQAVAGLDLKPGVHLEVADSPGAFAHHCARLLADEPSRRRLAEAGYEQVRRLYAWPVVQRQIRALAEQMLENTYRACPACQ